MVNGGSRSTIIALIVFGNPSCCALTRWSNDMPRHHHASRRSVEIVQTTAVKGYSRHRKFW